MQKKFVGQVRNEDSDAFLMTLGYFWNDTNVSDHEVKRTRKYTHAEMQFPEMDPYKKLYELADAENASSFWLQLEACQQSRSEASWCGSGLKKFNAFFDEFQAFKYLKFTDTNEEFEEESCFEMAEPTEYMRTGKIWLYGVLVILIPSVFQ